MAKHDVDLDAIEISSPCTVPWSSMKGDEVKRYCDQCRLHVYDLSQMTRPRIQQLFRETGGAICKRIWRRPDGTILTKDCQRVVPALRRRLRALATAAAGVLALVGLLGCGSESASPTKEGAEPATTTPTTTPTTEPATPPDTSGTEKKPEPDATEFIGR